MWSYGHRNVQGIGWDASGRMYASEFGQNTWDELNRIEPGHNYGWPVVEGMGTAADVARGFTRPLAVWPTDDASPSGIAVGRGAVWMAALRGERLWRVPLRADGSVGTPRALLQGRYGRLARRDLRAERRPRRHHEQPVTGQPHPRRRPHAAAHASLTSFQYESLRVMRPSSARSNRSQPRTSTRSPSVVVPVSIQRETPRSPQTQCSSSP